MKLRPIVLRPIMVLVAVGASLAWASSAAPGPQTLVFSHAEHLACEPGASCTDCHVPSKVGRGEPALVGARCQHCHDDTLRYQPRAPAAHVNVRFPHARHAMGVSCTQCHQPARAPSKDDGRLAEWKVDVGPERCIDCHKASKKAPAETSCRACHVEDRRRQAPISHDQLWTRTHGPLADLDGPAAHGVSCSQCHRPSDCRSCHQVMQPKDHNGLWRMRTHGPAAQWDRQRCKLCHQTGGCISCHRTTPPINHRGAWNATHALVADHRLDQRCLTCHRPNFCVDCHRVP